VANTTASLSQSEQDLLAADKPLIATWPHVSDDIEWRSALSFSGGSSLDDTALPPARLIDGFSHVVSQPNTAAAPIFALFDFIALIQHNLGNLTAVSPTLDFFVADDAAFSVNLRTGTTGPQYFTGDNDRIIELDLRHSGSPAAPQRYSNVQFCAIEFSGIDGSAKPFVGEIIWGRRRQLEFKPNVPWGPDDKASEAEDFISKSGVITRYPKHVGRRQIAATINPSADPFRSDIISFFENSNFGTDPFVWIEDPSTTPRGFNLMMMENPELMFPLVGPFERNWNLVAREQGPDFLALE